MRLLTTGKSCHQCRPRGVFRLSFIWGDGITRYVSLSTITCTIHSLSFKMKVMVIVITWDRSSEQQWAVLLPYSLSSVSSSSLSSVSTSTGQLSCHNKPLHSLQMRIILGCWASVVSTFNSISLFRTTNLNVIYTSLVSKLFMPEKASSCIYYLCGVGVYEFWDTNFNIMYKFWGTYIVLYAGVVSITWMISRCLMLCKMMRMVSVLCLW